MVMVTVKSWMVGEVLPLNHQEAQVYQKILWNVKKNYMICDLKN